MITYAMLYSNQRHQSTQWGIVVSVKGHFGVLPGQTAYFSLYTSASKLQTTFAKWTRISYTVAIRRKALTVYTFTDYSPAPILAESYASLLTILCTICKPPPNMKPAVLLFTSKNILATTIVYISTLQRQIINLYFTNLKVKMQFEYKKANRI